MVVALRFGGFACWVMVDSGLIACWVGWLTLAFVPLPCLVLCGLDVCVLGGLRMGS